MPPPAAIVHPAWLRLTHWLNVVAVVVLVTSGWRIYNASPLMDFRFPAGITLGGWLGGALQWHFAAMWLLVFNGLVYLAINVGSGRFRRRFLPLDFAALWRDVQAALRGRLSHGDTSHYNAIQRFAYLFAMAALVVIVLSGLAIWKSVQLPWLRELMGGYDSARWVHFIAMASIVAFVFGHALMALSVPRTLLAMVRGR